MSSQVYSFDPAYLTWSSHGYAPFSLRQGAGMIAINTQSAASATASASALLLGGRTDYPTPFPTDQWLIAAGVVPPKWTAHATKLPFTRADFGLVEWRGLRWIIGGADFGASHNDVWTQSELGNWTQRANAPFTPRHSFGCVVYRDAIYVIGQSQRACTPERSNNRRDACTA